MSFNNIFIGPCRNVISALLSLGLCSACVSTPPEAVAPQVGSWLLQAWVINGESQPLNGAAKTPTLIIQPDGGIGGYSGVNRYNTTAEFRVNDKLVISPQIISTRRAGPPAAMEQERLFLSSLPGFTEYRFIDGQLRFESNQSWMQFQAE